jgi:triacylglycerol lipase
MKNQCPIILVHGIFGYGSEEMLGFSYWGQAKKVPCELPLYETSVGPISSHHDRACELYAQIKGTQVDYGEDHAKQEGHKRFGKDYTGKGFYKDWSAEKPIYLVGHSMGGPTIRMLQYLLSTHFWDKENSENWIKII